MDRRTGLVVVGWVLAALVVVGVAVVSLSLVVVVVFPAPLELAYLGLTFVTVITGGVLCRRYLQAGPGGYTLGPAARRVRWWVLAVGTAGFVALFVVIIISAAGGPKGDAIRTPDGGYALRYKTTITDVSRAEWLAARQLETRVMAGAPAAFACPILAWCVACSRAEPEDVVPRHRKPTKGQTL